MTLEAKLNQEYRNRGEGQVASRLRRRKIQLEYERDIPPEKRQESDFGSRDFCYYDDYTAYSEGTYQS